MFNFGKNNKEKVAIVKMDGGICSQIAFCALGFYLEDLGYKVKYDLSWFKECGKDCNNKFVRNYDMPLLFPNLNLEIATDEEIKKYRKLKTITNKIPEDGEPAYIQGYPPERFEKLIDYAEKFKQYLKPLNLESCNDILEKINAVEACAVHVRRGDLGVYTKGYGHPTPKEYYIKAINIIKRLYPETKFFFFSEECDRIKEEIIPMLSKDIQYEICDKNGADKGYLDLFLMTKCKHLIASIGSLAKFAKLLKNNDGGVIVLDSYDKNIVEHCENVIVLNDTILLNSNGKGVK